MIKHVCVCVCVCMCVARTCFFVVEDGGRRKIDFGYQNHQRNPRKTGKHTCVKNGFWRGGGIGKLKCFDLLSCSLAEQQRTYISVYDPELTFIVLVKSQGI